MHADFTWAAPLHAFTATELLEHAVLASKMKLGQYRLGLLLGEAALLQQGLDGQCDSHRRAACPIEEDLRPQYSDKLLHCWLSEACKPCCCSSGVSA